MAGRAGRAGGEGQAGLGQFRSSPDCLLIAFFVLRKPQIILLRDAKLKRFSPCEAYSFNRILLLLREGKVHFRFLFFLRGL